MLSVHGHFVVPNLYTTKPEPVSVRISKSGAIGHTFFLFTSKDTYKMVRCPKCKTENPEKYSFCHNCGTALNTNCCGCCSRENPLVAKFCRNCGRQLVDKTARRKFSAYGKPYKPKKEEKFSIEDYSCEKLPITYEVSPLVSLKEAQALVNFIIMPGDDISKEKGWGDSLRLHEIDVEGEIHKGLREKSIRYFKELGYRINQSAVGIAGEYVIADYFVVKDKRFYFVECLSSSLIKKDPSVIYRKLKLARFAPLWLFLKREQISTCSRMIKTYSFYW